jgi:hypothetical protein
MKKLITLFILFTSYVTAYSQTTEHEAVKKVVNNMFKGMRTGDTVLLKSTFSADMVLQSLVNKKDGSTALITQKAEGFTKQVGAAYKEVYDERITIADIKIDGPLASVWAPYKFYIGTTFSHCGVNVFQLMKTALGWKIIYIVDTRRKDNCVE